MSNNNNNNNNNQSFPHYVQTTSPCTKGILQKSHDYEEHETPEYKLKWDENKLKITEKQKQQVQMKVDEPNTPYVRYDPVTDQITNWQDIPEKFRKGAQEEPDEFSLQGDDDEKEGNTATTEGNNISFGSISAPVSSSNEWDKVDEQEERDKEEAARKRHEAFEKKRAQHYYHLGNVMHEDLNSEENSDSNSDSEK